MNTELIKLDDKIKTLCGNYITTHNRLESVKKKLDQKIFDTILKPMVDKNKLKIVWSDAIGFFVDESERLKVSIFETYNLCEDIYLFSNIKVTSDSALWSIMESVSGLMSGKYYDGKFEQWIVGY